jgi:amino acid transporter
VYNAGEENRSLRIVGDLLFISACIGMFWPPMHQRTVLAAGGGSLTDTLHLVFAAVTVILMILAIAFGAAALGKKFKIFSIATLIILVVFGILTGIDSPRLESNLPTPWIGVWERVNIGAYMVWIIVLALNLLRMQAARRSIKIFSIGYN